MRFQIAALIATHLILAVIALSRAATTEDGDIARFTETRAAEGAPWRDHAVEYAIGETSLILMLPETPAYLALTVVLIALSSDLAIVSLLARRWGAEVSLRYLLLVSPLLLFLFYRRQSARRSPRRPRGCRPRRTSATKRSRPRARDIDETMARSRGPSAAQPQPDRGARRPEFRRRWRHHLALVGGVGCTWSGVLVPGRPGLVSRVDARSIRMGGDWRPGPHRGWSATGRVSFPRVEGCPTRRLRGACARHRPTDPRLARRSFRCPYPDDAWRPPRLQSALLTPVRELARSVHRCSLGRTGRTSDRDTRSRRRCLDWGAVRLPRLQRSGHSHESRHLG